MRQFKITCIKVQKVIANQNSPVYLTEQLYETDAPKMEYKVPDGYTVMSICEILPPVFDSVMLHADTPLEISKG